MALTPEELRELEELNRMAEDQPEAEIEAEPVQDKPLTEEIKEQATSLGLGAIEGVPFAKDAIAAVETGVEFVEGNNDLSVEALKEGFNKNKSEIQEEINKARERNPVAFHSGDFASSAATMFIPGLNATKGLKAIGAAAALGGASALSRSEDREVSDLLSGGASGAVFGALGLGVSRGISKVADKLQWLSIL